MGMSSCDVVIAGAGPYGLSAAAHLRTVKGLEVRVFGEPMSFWDRNMPVGMFLRSNWTATQIADPDGMLSLEAFQAASGVRFSTPVPLDRFIEYGLWFQRQALPDLDQRKIARIESDPKGWLPAWLVNFFQKDWARETIEGIRKQCAKKDLRAPPAFAEFLGSIDF